MILRVDRLQTELPPPSDPDPVGASAVQELLGGKFGEMSTFMNYTYQSFNFRNRQGAGPSMTCWPASRRRSSGTSSWSRPPSTRC
jgi:Mn-containing catalase